MTEIRFESLEFTEGIRISALDGQERTELRFEQPRTWTDADPAGFPFPVSDAVRTTLSGFSLTPFNSMYVRDTTGQAFISITPGDTYELPESEYCLELCTPVKTYLRFRGGYLVESSPDRIRVEFDDPTAIEIGARSPRSGPPGTITTSPAPEDIMEAVSRFGSGFETTSPSRTYPTVRGYPPLVELGSELTIPDGVTRSASSVRFEVPPTLEYVFPAVSLAYYFDATLQPGESPRLLVDGEAVAEIDSGEYLRRVEQLLKQVFFLDCLTRTLGHYPFETRAYRRIAPELPFDVGDLGDADLGARIREYLEVPFTLLEPELPSWGVTASVEPEPRNVRALPHLAYQLAVVETRRPERISGFQARRRCMRSFMEHYDTGPTRIAEDVFESEASFVDVPRAENSDATLWMGEDIPLGTNKLLVEGYDNRLERDPIERSTIDVNIICNEPWMDGEASVSRQRYDDRLDLPFDVTVYEHVGRDEMAALFESDADLLHYIGHARPAGLQCQDGYFEVDSVSSIGADMFLLNACQSYEPGLEMVRNGCIGGIATLSEVTDDEAATVGRTVSRLLNLGFPLRYALLIARRRSIVGGQYLAVGDDSASLVEPESSLPYECIVESSGDGYEATVRTYPTNRFHLGSLFRPNVGPDGQQYLAGKSHGPFEMPSDELASFLEMENVPVSFDDEFYWAFDLAAEIRQQVTAG